MRAPQPYRNRSPAARRGRRRRSRWPPWPRARVPPGRRSRGSRPAACVLGQRRQLDRGTAMPDAARGFVGDDERERALVASALEAEGDRVATAPGGAAPDLVRGELPGLLRAGVGLPPRPGRALTGASRRPPGPPAPVVGLVARGPGRPEAAAGGGLATPVDLAELTACAGWRASGGARRAAVC